LEKGEALKKMGGCPERVSMKCRNISRPLPGVMYKKENKVRKPGKKKDHTKTKRQLDF